MRTRTTSATLIACLLALIAVGAGFYFNSPAVVANDKEGFEFGAEIEHPFGEKSVKGAPFSAQVTIESSQTLANGVHLSRKATGALYRDSEGRTRQEFPRDGAPEIVMINDNVAGALYRLHMFDRTVRKVNIGYARVKQEVEERARSEEMKASSREREERERMQKTKLMNRERAGKESEPLRKVESLGLQAVDGVQAEGKRFTVTIPAGMEGNDQPFEIVSERWYSPELQVVVMIKRSDPRTGDLVYRLTNINRSEQAHSLFEAPADFTVTEEKTEYRKKS